MINFKTFINAIHEAILSANDKLMDKNVELLDKYFEEVTIDDKDETTGKAISKTRLDPKTVILEYPSLTADGVETSEVHVPLITLVPLQQSQIEKAVLTAEFEMEVVDDEIEVNFVSRKSSGGLFKKPKTSHGKLEITLSPLETTEGIKLLVEGYEAILRRQLS